LIFEEKATNTLQPFMKDELNQLRVMDLFAEISQISLSLFTLSQPYLSPVIQAFHTTNDVLRKLNFVEIITKVYIDVRSEAERREVGKEEDRKNNKINGMLDKCDELGA
jgi:hypothetical protein